MIEVSDLTNIIPQEVLAMLSEAAVQEVLQDLAAAARAEWIRLAMDEFKTTRQDYVAGIQPVVYSQGKATITLLGQLPNMLEEGMDEVDLHDTLLGANVPTVPMGERGKHESADGGYYRAIPFRHATPGAKAGAVGREMGSAYSGHEAVRDAAKLGRKVYNAAKKLDPTRSKPGGPTTFGGRLPAGIAPKLREGPRGHATDIYAGMIRAQKTYEKATQSQYVTFRTIAVGPGGEPKGSSPWIRPATPGKFLAKKVNAFVAEIAPKAFSAYVESAGS